MDKGLTVFLSVLLLPSPTFEDTSCEDLLTYLKSLMGIGGKYNDSIIFHKTSKSGVKEDNLRTAN